MSVSYGGESITFEDGSKVSSGWTGFKNRIINGSMVIDQRNNGSVAYSNTSIGGAFCPDRFQVNMSSDATVSAEQSTDVPAGFKNSLKLSVTAADTSIGTNQYVQMFHNIEGNNIADLNWGTANAATITLSFWVKSSVAGQYPVRLVNGDGSRSYTFYTTINAINTWEYKTKVVPGPTNGTFNSTNDVGIGLGFSFGAGSFFGGATENVWNTTVSYQNSHMTPLVDWVGTVGNTFFITGVQFEKGSSASSFEHRPYGTELALCCRYFQKTYNDGVAVRAITSTGGIANQAQANITYVPMIWNFPVKMRATPTITTYSTATGAAGKFYSNAPGGDNNTFAGFVGASNATVTTGTTSISATGYVITHMTADCDL
jgi:hypothetical protein